MEAEFDRLQRYADRSFLVHAKQDADSYLDIIVSRDCKNRDAVKKELVASMSAFISSRGGSVLKC